jgi:metallo-beta-lactamase class B
MRKKRAMVFALTLGIAANFSVAGSLRAQIPADWTEPFPAFRVAGNLYYVGSKGLASYLITTPQGHILINSDLESSVPLIRASVESLGFKFSDIKILLISHAHWDHDGGSAAIKALTGAQYMVMDADVPVVESGGKADFHYGNQSASLYPPAKVDRVLHDGDEIRLGGTTLVAHLTPGHTKGCTTWTMKVPDTGKTYDVVIVGSPNVNEGYKLVDNASYPEIASDYERTFRVLKSLPVDIFLGAHGDYFDMKTKYLRLKEGAANPFVDPAGYSAYVADREAAFRTELAKQKAELANGKASLPLLDYPLRDGSGGERVVGLLTALTADSLAIRVLDDGSLIAVKRSDVVRIERRRRHTSVQKAALIGCLTFGGVLGLAGSQAHDPDSPGLENALAVVGFGLGCALGGLGGAGVGLLESRASWTEVQL